MRTERKPVWRHAIWQARGAAPQRWPLKLSLLLLTTLCLAAWMLVGGALHALYSAVG